MVSAKTAKNPNNIQTIYPLSPLQKGMLLESVKNTGTGIYITQPVFQLGNELDIQALEDAWRDVINHFDIFRTAIAYQGNDPLQIVLHQVEFTLHKEDYRTLSAPDREHQLTRFLHQEKHRHIDFSCAPLMSVALIHMSDTEYILVWTHHHIILDGWSLPQVIDALNQSYSHRLQGQVPALGTAPAYEAYIRWLTRQDQTQAEHFWRNYLTGIEQKLPLPLTRSTRPADMTIGCHYGEQRFTLPQILSEQLRSCARTQHITLSSMVQTAWGLLLARYTHAEDIVFGAVTSGRPPELPHAEQMVGLLINTVPVRVKIDSELNLQDLLTQLHEDNIQLRRYEYAALEDIIRWSGITSGEGLFDTIVAFENYPLEEATANTSGLPIIDVEGSERPHNPLTLACIPGDCLALHLFYDEYYYEARTFDRLYKHLLKVLEALTGDLSQLVLEVPLIGPEEYTRLMPVPLPLTLGEDDCLHQRFETLAAQSPQAIALLCDGESLTYQALNQRANQLAHHLLSYQVGPETVIGVHLERSLDLVISLLAIHKAGAAYLPLDPDYPEERLAFMLKDADIFLLLTHCHHKQRLEAIADCGIGVEAVYLDQAEISFDNYPHTNPLSAVSPDNLAYIIYTSGSTGIPKGTQVAHHQVSRLFDYTQAWYGFGAEDIWTLFHSFAFDFSVWELWGALAYGGCLVVVPYDVSRSTEDFYQLLCDEQVTVLNQTPSAFYQLMAVDEEQPADQLALRYVIFGGEALDLSRLQSWYARHDEQRPQLINMYGITETTVHVTYQPITLESVNSHSPSVIGGPIADLQLYVLDQRLQPVPIGVTGELYVGGGGVTWGYLKRARLTAERFVPNPFSAIPGDRLYRTGDEVHWLPEGGLVYGGRIDNQVKVRGYRIELAEIESALTSHETIVEAAVILDSQGEDDHKQLVAYYVLTSADEELLPDLRSFMAERLPTYMIPALFVGLEALPLTANGKLDRKALPKSAVAASLSVQLDQAAAGNALEQALVAIWQEVLKHEPIGVHDNYFELGGDSILSIQIASRASKAGYPVKVKDIFSHPTIHLLARHCQQVGSQVHTPQNAVQGEQILLPVQQWFFEQRFEKSQHWYHVYLLQAPANLSLQKLQSIFSVLAESHDILRLRFSSTDAKNWQAYYTGSEENSYFLTEIDLSLQNEKPEAIATALQQLSFHIDITDGPLLAVALLQLNHSLYLGLLAHQLITDHLSLQILIRDMDKLYSQLNLNRSLHLPEKTTPYQYWAKQLHDYGKKITENEKEYWCRDELLTTSVSRDHQSDHSHKNCCVEFTFSEIQSKLLLQEVNEAYRTETTEILLCGLYLALNKVFRQKQFLVAMELTPPGSLFADVELSRTVGQFSGHYPLLLTSGSLQAAKAIPFIKENIRTVPMFGMGFGLLKYFSDNTSKTHLHSIKPQISFVYRQWKKTLPLNSLDTFKDISDELNTTEKVCEIHQHPLEIIIELIGNKLKASLSYNSTCYNENTIRLLEDAYRQSMDTIISHCLKPQVGAITPADISVAKLTEEEIKEVLEEIGLKGKPRQIEAIYPLSPLQKGILFESLRSPGSGIYVVQPVLILQSPVEVEILEQAWKDVIKHFPILRTAFAYKDRTEPLQVVLKDLDFSQRFMDWSELDKRERLRRFDHLLEKELKLGFEFHLAPLMSATLVRFTQDEYQLVWTHHHILLDGWSVPPVFQTLRIAYDARLQGRSTALIRSEPYLSYIEWLYARDQQQAKVFWQEYLHGFEEKLPLPLVCSERRQDLAPGLERKQLKLNLSLPVSDKINKNARQTGVTPNIIIQAALGLLLRYYTGRKDVVFGTVTSGRASEINGVETMAGLLINTLPVRVNLNNPSTIKELWQQLQEDNLQLRAHEYASLNQIRDWSGVTAGESLFDIIYVFENYPLGEAFDDNSALKVKEVSAVERQHNPLTLAVVPSREIGFYFFFDHYYYDTATIKRFHSDLGRILDLITEDVDSAAGDFVVPTKEELSDVTKRFNDTQKTYSLSSIASRFEQVAQQQADHRALVFGEQSLSYRELNKQANQLAHHLQQTGVLPGDSLALLLQRSVDVIVATLAVIKLGAVYMPLDPESPTERLHYMIDAARARLLITHDGINEDIRESLTASIPNINLSHLSLKGMEDNPNIAVLPQAAAYIMYTSGSTGQPKGVMVSHQAVLRLVSDPNYLPIHQHHVFLQLAPTTFDASTLEIWGALLNGAHLVIAPTRTPGIEELGQLILQHRISTLWLTAAFFHLVVRENIQALRGLQYLLAGGDVLSPQVVTHLLARYPDLTLINGYGPTENTTFTCCHSMQSSIGGGSIPIGRPISNTTTYVLDDNLQPVGVGVVGELYAGGDGLAQGYLNFSAMTASVFIPDSFSTTPGSRLYQTGDLVRWREDGSLEFMGRKDLQVKVRGFRIEPGEIEAQLNRHERIREAVVIVNEEGGNKHLLAFYIVREESSPSAMELRSYLLSCLPAYMVPAFFVELDTFPLTTNGKLDRRQLLTTATVDNRQQSDYAIANNEVEQALVEIWQEVLRHSSIGVHDNFFELGGDSILSIQIASRAAKHGHTISVQDIFTHSTIHELAQHCSQTQKTVYAPQEQISGEQKLLPIQQWFFAQQLNNPAHWNQSFLINVPNDLTVTALTEYLEILISHHDALRLRFSAKEEQYDAYYGEVQGSFALQSINLSSLSTSEQNTELARLGSKIKAKLNLDNGPLVQALLLTLGESGLLLLSIHHLVIDTVSWRIILEDLELLYQQKIQGEQLRLPAKTSPYQYWAKCLSEYANRGISEEELNYWHRPELTDITLPHFDKKASLAENTVETTRSISLNFDQQLTQVLLEKVSTAYNTRLDELLLCAFLRAYHHCTRSHSLLINMESHGRQNLFDDINLMRTVGWFTTMYPVACRVAGADGVNDAKSNQKALAKDIIAVKESLRSVPNKGIAYGLIRYFKKNEIEAAYPLVSFNYLGQFDQTFAENSPFGFADNSGHLDTGEDVAQGEKRQHLLDIVSYIQQGQLTFSIHYSDVFYLRKTIQQLVEHFSRELQAIAAHCQQPGIGSITPSDISLAAIDGEKLQKILMEVGACQSPAKVETIYPASPLQVGMLVETLKQQVKGIYITQPLVHIHGTLNVKALENAWRDVIQYYGIFRTAFAYDDYENPFQVVFKSTDFILHREDFRGLSSTDQEQSLVSFLHNKKQQGVDFSKAPLMSVDLLQMAEAEYILVWTHHHIILDGWSLPHVIDALNRSYSARVQGQVPVLGIAPSYESYIHWLTQQDQAEAEHFWREYLAGIKHKSPLPLTRSAPPLDSTPGTHYGEQRFTLSSELSEQLQIRARSEHVTLSSIMQIAWSLLLYRYTQAEDLIFGAVTSGRPPELPHTEQIVGLLINTIPVRVQIDKELSLHDLLSQLHDDNIKLRRFEYAALADITRWSGLTGGEGLFDTIVAFENYPLQNATAAADGLPVIGIEGSERPHNPLTLACIPGESLSLHFFYDEYYFEPAVFKLFYGYLLQVLQAFVDDPSQSLGQINLLSNEERQQLVEQPNHTKTSLPRISLAQAFERVVTTQPDSIALISGHKKLTYQQLNNRSNQLAHHLQQRGIEPGHVVALLFNRCIDTVVAMMAVIKAGAVYLPLDTDSPTEHIKRTLISAKTSLVLTQDTDMSLPADMLIIELEDYLPDTYPTTNLPLSVMPLASAYVMYTSGSTGLPKGIITTHQAVMRLVTDPDYLPISHEDTFLQLAPTAFDAATLEIWGPLLNGARLVIAPPGTVDVNDLGELIRTNEVTTLWLTAAFFHLVVRENIRILAGLRFLLAGGDVLFPKAITQVLKQFPKLHLINGYGPTENTTFTCCHRIQQLAEGGTIPIGSPISNTTAYVLCQQLEPVGVGVVGELYTGGTGLAHGYLHDPGLTAHSFLPNHFSTEPGERLYRTGDLVRWRHDQTLEFIGRRDNQVKVRGFRIELGEIEAHLNRHEQIQEAVVLIRDEGSIKHLMAFYIPEANQSPDASALRSYLQEQLPSHMVPAFFVTQEAFPITSNGKLDKKALLISGKIERPESDDDIAPTTEAERCLQDIWQEVLKHEPIGVHDNYFELGGDSILSIQIASRANKAGYPVKLKDIFTYPTIHQLAQRCQQTDSTIHAPQEAVQGEQILLPIQQWFFAQQFKQAQHWNQSFLMKIPNDWDDDSIANALAMIMTEHDVFNLRFTLHENNYMAEYTQSQLQALEFHDLSQLPKDEQLHQMAHIGTASKSSLSLRDGPLVKAVLFTLREERKLLLTAHHLVMDIVSSRVIFEDLKILYRQFKQKHALRLPSKTTSYQYWGEKLSEFVTQGNIDEELAYWTRTELADVQNLPSEFNANPEQNTANSIGIVEVSMDDMNTQSLVQHVHKAYNTQIEDLLLCALIRATRQWCKLPSLLINLESHGREALFSDVDLARTVGWFTAIYPLVLTVRGDNFAADIIAVKEQFRAIPNKGIGYGLLKTFAKEKLPDIKPNVSFNYLGQFDQKRSEQDLFDFSNIDISTGCETDPEEKCAHILDVVGRIHDRRLMLSFFYSNAFFSEAKIRELADIYILQMQKIIAHCMNPESGQWTDSDLKTKEITEDVISDIYDEIFDDL